MPFASPSLDDRVVLWPSQSLAEWKRNPTPGNQPCGSYGAQRIYSGEGLLVHTWPEPLVRFGMSVFLCAGLHKVSKHSILPADSLVHIPASQVPLRKVWMPLGQRFINLNSLSARKAKYRRK